jgi:DNA-binding transcriptional ArsR family regulator
LTGAEAADIFNHVVEGEGDRRQLTRTFAALGDPTRRAMLMDLATAGEATVSGLAAGRPMSLAAVSKHLKVLEDAGLIQREVRGRQHFCRLRAAPLAAASEWVELCRRFWEQRLDRLEELLTAAPPDDASVPGTTTGAGAGARPGGRRRTR